MAIATTNSLVVSQTIRADAERLFRAWTDPEELKHWWRMDEKGWRFDAASIDLRVGGRYRLGMTSPDGNTYVAVGVYREIQRPTRLVFTWDWEGEFMPVGETLVTVEFKDSGNQTEVVLTHERFADPSRVARHEQGWSQMLRLLDSSVTERGSSS
jgi:uncharacterized protein YndB with AHSA1/START domain